MQRNGWKIILGVFIFAAATARLPSARADDAPELIAELERTAIYEGESVIYRVTLNHVEHPRQPDLKPLAADFQVVPAGEQSLDSHMVTIINGQRSETVRRGRQYNYRLTPKRTGTLTIPAPTVEIDGRQLRGQELTLLVRSPNDQDIVRMEIRADRRSIYPMQPFTVTLSIAVKSLPRPFEEKDPVAVQSSPPLLQIPWAIDEQLPHGLQPKLEWRRWLGAMENQRGAGFNVNNLGRESIFSLLNQQRSAFLPECEKVSLPDKAGKQTTYWRYEFRRTFLAKSIGPYSFGPVSLKGLFATGGLNETGQPIAEDIYATAKPLTLDVRDVPLQGRPDCYIGAVGVFHLAADLEPKRAKTGDPMTLTLTLDGEGTLDSATPPNLSAIPAISEHFKVYAPTDQTKKDQRQFTYSLRPLDANVREFPPVPAAYFDVDAGRYVTLRSEPIPIEVSKAMRLASRDIIASGGPAAGSAKEIEARQGGIFANVTDPGQLCDDSIRPERWLAGVGGLAAAYIALAFVVGRWRRLTGDTAMLRRRAAVGVARRRLHEASADFAAGRTREGADHVLAAALGLVADMLGLPAAGMTSAEACRQLESAGVAAELIGRLRSLLDTCEGVRYGGDCPDFRVNENGTVPFVRAQSFGRDGDKLLRALAGVLRKKRRLPPVQAAILLAVALFGGCGRSTDFALVQKFQAAQQAFDDARKPEEFAKAAMLDQEILDRWGLSGPVLYNQGNAWMQAGQPGRAVASYRLAQRYLPRDPRLDANLLSALGDASPARRPVIETIFFWQDWLSYPEKFYLGGIIALATFAAAAASLFTARRWLRRLAWVGLAITAVMAFSAAYDWQRFDSTRHGVVIQRETIARKGNGPNYEPAFKEPLGEATEFRLLEQRGDWLLIRLPGGEGWIEQKAAVTY
jgi:hypothetical protein